MLWRLIPRALRVPAAAQPRTVIASLEAEVSQRASAEENLRDVQQALAITLESTGAGFIATDRAGRVTRLNATAGELLGWTEAEARGEGLWTVFAREGRPEVDSAMNPIDVMLREGTSAEQAHRVVAISRTGVKTPLEVKAALTHDPDGAPRGMAVVLRDLSAELAADATSRRLAAIVESSGDAIVGKTLEGRITSWNPGAVHLFGYEAVDAIGQSMLMLIPPDRADEESAILARIARGETVDHFETVRRRKDGSLVDISTTISPVRDTAGHVVGASKIARDITERKRGDMRLLAQLQRLRLLDQITRAVGERLDLASVYQVAVRSLADELPAELSCVLTCDAAARQLLVTSVGHAVDHEVLSASAIIPVDGNGLSRCLQGELVYEADTSVVAFPFPQRLAQAGMLSLVIAPLRSEGQVFGVLLAARSRAGAFSSGECEFIRQLSSHVALAAHQAKLYGDLQAAFDELSRSQQAAMQQERLRALGQMASGIAHDINNALSPAALYAESILEHETLSERARAQMQSIARAVDDIAATVARLRGFYRSGEPQVHPLPMSLNALVRQVVELSHARWCDIPQEHGVVIEVITELDADLPAVWGIESELRDALVNLVFNAIDAMPRGGQLTLRTRRVVDAGASEAPAPDDAARVAVDVVDTGIGMDEHARLHCLEPFFTTKGERGTGLGLAMVYGAAQRHGAQIQIDSEPGKGSRFSVLFKSGPQHAPDEPIRPGVTAPGVPQTILLIDDDPALLRSLRDILEADGHTIQMADGGRAGLDAFAQAVERGRVPDLVITDLGMPHVDGRSVAAAVKMRSPATPVVLLTGWGQRMVEDGERVAHIDVVLSKPPKLAELRAAIERCRRQGPQA